MDAPVEFTLPDVAEGLADAEIVRWLVPEGGAVTLDEAFIEIETDKAVVDIPAPVTGTLQRHGAAVGEVVKVGALLAVFLPQGVAAPADGGGSAEAVAPPGGSLVGTDRPDAVPADAPAGTATQPVPAGAPDPPGAASGPAPSGRRPRATPATRRLARELGVDLADVTPSGEAGRILDADVQAFADGEQAPRTQTPAPASSDGRAADDRSPTSKASGAGHDGAPQPALDAPLTPPSPQLAAAVAELGEGDLQHVALRGLRRATARTMTQSWTTVPHVNSIHEVDLHALQALRGELKAAGHPVPATAFMVRAAALALRDFPTLNATVDAEREEIVLIGRRHIGVAMDAPDGLIVPVIADADRKGVRQIGRELVELSQAATTRSLSPAQLQGGTFTLNNYGTLGGWFGTSLVKPPEVAICSFGGIRDQVVPHDGEIVIRPIAVMTLAADHRAGDGRELIGFCLAVRERLEHPLTLLVEE